MPRFAKPCKKSGCYGHLHPVYAHEYRDQKGKWVRIDGAEFCDRCNTIFWNDQTIEGGENIYEN